MAGQAHQAARSEVVIDRIAPPNGTASFFQVGYVVPDLQNALDFYTDRLGGGPFLVLRGPELRDETFHGRPYKPRQDLAFGYLGNLQFELICPTSGGDTSTYTEFLNRHPEGGLHHTATVVDDLDAGVRAIGLRTEDLVQTGTFGEATRFGYVEAPAVGGLLELLQLDAMTRELFDAVRRNELPEGM